MSPAPRIIDVHARPAHETLYDALVVDRAESSRKIRQVARELRRNLPDPGALHDICLAEEVLGRPDLRREYDALLARVRAAGQRLPKIGTAIEAEPLAPKGPSIFGKLLGRTTIVAVLFAGGLVWGVIGGGSHRKRYEDIEIKMPELPKFQPIQIDPKLFEYKPIPIPKLDLQPLDPALLAPPPKPIKPVKPRARPAHESG